MSKYPSERLVGYDEGDDESLNRVMKAYDELHERARDALAAWRTVEVKDPLLEEAMGWMADVMDNHERQLQERPDANH